MREYNGSATGRRALNIERRDTRANNSIQVVLVGDALQKECEVSQQLVDTIYSVIDGTLCGMIMGKKPSCVSKHTAHSLNALALGIASVIVVSTLFVMSVIADGYFCCGVQQLAVALQLPPVFAGVTLLPLGNGAPDVFSAIISATKGKSSVGAGAIGGAGLFVVTIVLGAVAHVAAPFYLNPFSFVRDVGFYILSTGWVIFCLLYDSHDAAVNFRFSMTLPGIYAVFILTVIVMAILDKSNAADSPLSGNGNNHTISDNRDLENHAALEVESPLSKKLEDFKHYDIQDYYSRSLHRRHHLFRLDYLGIVEGSRSSRRQSYTVNAPQPVTPEKDKAGIRIRRSRRRSLSDSAIDVDLLESLLGQNDKEGQTDNPVILSGSEIANRVPSSSQQSSSSFEDDGGGKSLVEKMKCMNAIELLEFPIAFLLSFTIPAPLPEMYVWWTMPFQIILVPFLVLKFAAEIIYGKNITELLPFSLLYVVGALLLPFVACVGYVHIHKSMTELGEKVSTFFCFVACIVWLSLTAQTLVNHLVVLGSLLHVEPFVLGMTVLAWGNSTADLLADIGIAKMPSAAPTAVAGTIAGPLFNLCIGLGTGMSISSYTAIELKEPFTFPGADGHTTVTLYCMLVGALVMTLGFVSLNGYTMMKSFTLASIVYYITSIVIVCTSFFV